MDSGGGLYTNLYARTFPQDVAAVVFVDSAHPDQMEWWSKNRPIYSGVITAISVINIYTPSGQETFVRDKVIADLRRAGPFPDVPVVVLTAGKGWFLDSTAWRAQWLQYQKELAALSPQGREITATESHHFIQLDQPELVVDSIRQLVEQVRRQTNDGHRNAEQ